ncbi:MAG: tyrosine-type recombinase/integrase [Pseudomonadota bacterium]|nr:tyrosine-type recombinase/integrase [Pseudomonadota bacterium]
MNTIEPERLPELLERLNRASIKYTTRCLIEWQLHTLCRPSEAACAKWSEIDFENAIWTIPAERMKARKEHKIPLTKQSLHLLELMKPISAHLEYIFPADRNPRTHTNPQTANAALKRMGFQNILVAHWTSQLLLDSF